MSIVVAVAASVLALITGVIIFFVIEPPFMVSIFVACALIAVGCFVVAGFAAYFASD